MSDERRSAYEFLVSELNLLNSQLKETEANMEMLEDSNNVSTLSEHPRYKRLMAKYESLNENACLIRQKLADFMTSPSHATPDGPVSSGSASLYDQPSGSKRKSNAMSTSNQSLPVQSMFSPHQNNLVSSIPQPVSSISQFLASAPEGNVTAIIDRKPADSTAMLVEENRVDNFAFQPSSNYLFPSASSNQGAAAWPGLFETVFKSAHVAPSSLSSHQLDSGSIKSSGSGSATVKNSWSGSVSSAVDNATVSGSQASFAQFGKPIGPPPGIPANSFGASITGMANSPQPTSNPAGIITDATSLLQTEEYVEMKKHIGMLMKLFHEKKLHFIALDGTPIFAQQYQMISQQVKMSDGNISDYMRGQTKSYITGVDKKKQTLTKMDLFLPEYVAMM